ncbi:MAG: hypothetical protein R6U32_01755 [Candidatus Woesearchaeota archaeon]
MIIDYRNSLSKINEESLRFWRAMGAETVLFTLHHPYSYSQMDKYKETVDMVNGEGFNAGIYTGLLGLEKESTISENPELRGWQQRDRNGRAVAYNSSQGRVFCPNSGYIEGFRLPLVQEAAHNLELDTVYFDLPWFLSGACFCDDCRDSFGSDFPSGWDDPNLADFLRFKNRSIRDAVKNTTGQLKQARQGTRAIYNFGSCLSRIDEIGHGSWITNLSDLESDILIEFNPYIAKTPLIAVSASTMLAKESLKGNGRAYFASTLRPGGRLYSPHTILELYSAVKRSGASPYLSGEIFDNPDSLPAPLEEYADVFEELKHTKPGNQNAGIGVVYDPLLQYFSEKPGMPRVSNGPRMFQREYLEPLWNCINDLEQAGEGFTLTTPWDIEAGRFERLILPREDLSSAFFRNLYIIR